MIRWLGNFGANIVGMKIALGTENVVAENVVGVVEKKNSVGFICQ